MKRGILPSVLPSASITSLLRYYDPSDNLTIILASSLLHLLANTQNSENCQVLPRLPKLDFVQKYKGWVVARTVQHQARRRESSERIASDQVTE